MYIDESCVNCIINQSSRVAEAITTDEKLKNSIVSKVKEMSKTFSFSQTPPEIAADVYETMAKIANKYDLYDTMKENATKKALSLLPSLELKLHTSNNKLYTATKIAVAGNVIDLASAVHFDLDEELSKIFHTEFAYNDFEKFKTRLLESRTLLYIGDNVGEHIFDLLFIQTLQNIYPTLKISYMVRGKPIINDVTIKEAKEAGFEDVCELVDSGVNTPGFAYNRANAYAKELFDSADMVISKGMGNYESLSPSHRKNICFLLKVKCDVVAASLHKELGDIICKFV